MWAWLVLGYLCEQGLSQVRGMGVGLSLSSMYVVLVALLRNNVQLFIPAKVLESMAEQILLVMKLLAEFFASQ